MLLITCCVLAQYGTFCITTVLAITKQKNPLFALQLWQYYLCFFVHVIFYQCAELPSQRAFLNQVLFNETILAVIGAGCTAATKPIAEISNYWGLSMVT